MLSIGLMSGTSMDGIDAALLETDGSAALIKDLGHITFSYVAPFKILLKAAEQTIRYCVGNMNEARICYPQMLTVYLKDELKIANVPNKINELSAYLYGDQNNKRSITLDDVIEHSTDLHAKATHALLKETGYQAAQIDVIGYHGQTMFHRPAIKMSVIVGNGQRLAEMLGITVISQFRHRDVMAGGEGAPFAPLYHHALAVRDHKIPVAVVNCGGIANITIIPSDKEMDLMAFDTGPGNGLIDRLVKKRTQGREHMDENGQYGRQGQVNEAVLAALYEKAIIRDGKNYFSQKLPKSLDIGDMALIPELDSLSLEDACVTLEAFTADTIVTSFKELNISAPSHWILAGGGWRNPMIQDELKNRLMKLLGNNLNMVTADQIGWNAQALEAQIFAYHAVRSLQNKPLSLPSTTRVPMPLSGGQAYIPSSGTTQSVQNLLQANPGVLSGYC